ncbi:synaptotagmin-like protein 2 [Tachyglossus aculeatus]|uniref:synaptotagmin-like protein 2 n=1 Tax=Tachyglossus aculeatus TaxID=9261 RepID=UPI0018F744B5|nr:synaptotagmin-like protein 2 [Tachyglossus aculeatus]
MKHRRDKMLDLSFLTEEEYEKLMKVLQRDAELKKKDSDRIRRLQGSLKDDKKKKFVTGEWFSEAKAQRFQEELQGPDLLRASIRRKKGPKENGSQEPPGESLRWTLSPETSLPFSRPSPTPHDGRPGETDLINDNRRHPSPKPRPRLATLPTSPPSDKRLSDVSPADSGIGLSPFLIAADGSQLLEKDLDVPSTPAMVPERDPAHADSHLWPDQPAVPGSPARPTVDKKSPRGETGPGSRIPIKRKSSLKWIGSEPVPSSEERPETQREPLAPGDLSSPTGKPGGPYTISPMRNGPKDEQIGLNREHFRNLKDFWEKGAECAAPSSASEAEEELGGRASGPGRSAPGPPAQEQAPRSRLPHKRPATVSSSEDEPIYSVPHRKGVWSSAPRSTHAKAHGAAATRSDSSEDRGRQPLVGEDGAPRPEGRKSRLPIRIPSLPVEPPPRQAAFEPETPADEYVLSEESTPTGGESLQNRVKIMIETVESEDEDPGDWGQPVGKKPPGMTSEPDQGRKRKAPGVDSATPSSTEVTGCSSPVVQALARASGVNLAKSMVNIYTSTETYNKPQNRQLLEPERAKDLSRSTPAFLSETESDTASEISFQFSRHKKTPSIGSHSSDMASVSSVSGSVLSVYSGDFGSVGAQGTVQFALDYDEKNREFQIFVSQCKDLATVDERKGRSDPYVKTYLLPDKARMGKRKTSVKKRTVNPIYNEVLKYKIEKMVLLIQKLNLSVWHNDPLGRNSFLGEMEIDLASWDWGNRKLNWYTLKPRSLSALNGVDHRGVMNLSIKYIPPGSLGPKNPVSGEVHIWVKDTKDLPQLRPSGVDSFVKCYVLPDTSKKSYQKTRVIKRDPNPIFNHTIVYDGFHTEDLKDACVELTVWDHEKLTNHFLGGLRLGLGTGSSYGVPVDWMDSTQEEMAFWQDMMSAPNEWIEGSLPLRSLAGRRKLK